jgi:hypothetical protein
MRVTFAPKHYNRKNLIDTGYTRLHGGRMKPITIRLPDEVHDEMKGMAEVQGLKLVHLVRSILVRMHAQIKASRASSVNADDDATRAGLEAAAQP